MCFNSMNHFHFRAALCAVTAVIFLSVFSACTPELTIQAAGTDQAVLSFSAGFSKEMEKTFRSMMSALSADSTAGSSEDSPIFNANDITALMQSAGVRNVKTNTGRNGAVSASGVLRPVSQSTLAQTGMLSEDAHSLTLTFGITQFQKLYALLDEEAQAYFDLLMIPALNEEKMTPAEYNETLASMYGKPFADEITNGTLTIALVSPDGKKKVSAKTTLGELLTLTKDKSWSVQF